MQCLSIVLIMHQELRVMPLWIQWLNYHDVLIEFDSKADVEWVSQKLLRMEWWMGASCNLKCVPCTDEEGLQQLKGGEGIAPRVDSEWIDLSSKGQSASMRCVGWPHSYDQQGSSVPRCNSKWA